MGYHQTLVPGYFTFTADMREMVNACFYLEHTGCPWRSLPTNFGAWQTVRTWYDRFRTDGVWADAAAQLTRRVREAHGHSGGAGDRDHGFAKRRLRPATR